MNFHPDLSKKQLPLSLANLLTEYRKERHFNAESYIENKIFLLNQYCTKNKINALIVGVSGGIDSAIVLGLIKKAQAAPNSFIKSIYPLIIPVHRSEFTQNQEGAAQKGLNLCKQFNLAPIYLNLSAGFLAVKNDVDGAFGIQGNSWAGGQLVSYLRTTSLYYATSLVTQKGERGVLVGTTNLDEGGYIGFFGKASDGMTDLQLISDLHKSEVYQVGRALDVTEEIMSAVPTGDMFDGRVDEDVFGAPYDFVELYHHLLKTGQTNSISSVLSTEDLQIFLNLQKNIEDLHNYNKHKYVGYSPAIHLDVLPTSIPGGWKYAGQVNEKKVDELNHNKIVNLQYLDVGLNGVFSEKAVERVALGSENLNHTAGFIAKNVLSVNEVDLLKKELLSKDFVVSNEYGKIESGQVGALRLSFFSSILANKIFKNLPILDFIQSNAKGMLGVGDLYKSHSVNPLFRCINYQKDSFLVPHYDAPTNLSGLISLYSVIVYLDDAKTPTRFLKETRDNHQFEDAKSTECFDVEKEIYPEAGSVLIFPHRVLHDSPVAVSNKMILRTDLFFTKLGV